MKHLSRGHQPRLSRATLRGVCGMAATAAVLLLGTSGCGKSLQTGASPSDINRISIAAATDGTIRAGETKRFQAIAVATNGQPVPSDYSWSVDPASLGNVVGQGAECLVTGGTPGTGKLTAVASNGTKAEFPITVTSGQVTDIRVEPVDAAKTTVEAGETVEYKATGVDLGGNVVGASRSRVVISPAWSVGGGIGTITSTGTFTGAGAGIGKTGQVIAKVDSVTGTLNVTITQGSRALYVGADTCKGCHAEGHTDWLTTAHAKSYDKLKSMGRMPGCVNCHVVGLNKGGFVDEATTPHLTGIQCENCHGPGSQHVAGSGDKSKILTGDQVLHQPQICGECHTGTKHGQFDEWAKSPHAENTPEGPTETIPTATQIGTCGVCHGGLGRDIVREKGKAGLPTSAEFVEMAEGTPQPCTTCHDPHKATGKGSNESGTDMQLRAPTQSTAFYTVNYSAADIQQQLQNAGSINICGGCHNSRNAYWQSNGRPPHHSPQYNMLIGDVGKYTGTTVVSDPAPATAQSAHRNVEGQCTTCHMYSDHSVSPVIWGHTFRVNMKACEPCHSAADAGARRASTQTDIRQRMDALKARLDVWATTKAPAALTTKYGKLAWEFTNEGALSNPNGDSAIVGPNSTEQKTIPAEVQQARWNLYMVLHDGSYGVHNANFARYMLQQANDKLTSIGVP